MMIFKKIKYRLPGTKEAVTREHLQRINNTNLFFVEYSFLFGIPVTGFIIPITPETDTTLFSKVFKGEYVYRSQLETLL